MRWIVAGVGAKFNSDEFGDGQPTPVIAFPWIVLGRHTRPRGPGMPSAFSSRAMAFGDRPAAYRGDITKARTADRCP
jgi:hypothetical protein